MATEEDFDDVQLDDTSAGSKPELANESTGDAAAETQNELAERPIERSAEYVANADSCRLWIGLCCIAPPGLGK